MRMASRTLRMLSRTSCGLIVEGLEATPAGSLAAELRDLGGDGVGDGDGVAGGLAGDVEQDGGLPFAVTVV